MSEKLREELLDLMRRCDSSEKQVLMNPEGLPESELDYIKLTVTVMRRTVAGYMALGPFKPNEISERRTLSMK